MFYILQYDIKKKQEEKEKKEDSRSDIPKILNKCNTDLVQVNDIKSMWRRH